MKPMGEIPCPTANQVSQDALGESEAFLSFMEHLSQAAKVDRPVLVIGERGTGKELAARRLHFLSSRWQAPLVTLNCAVLPATLIETELFGSEAGAYTGAQKLRAGRFETAHTGTLFLDEIGNMPLTAQEKLLRVVEYGTFERVGGSKPVNVDVRIVGATNKNLKREAEKGRFLRDLLDRLAFEVLKVPPLKERGATSCSWLTILPPACIPNWTARAAQILLPRWRKYSWPMTGRAMCASLRIWWKERCTRAPVRKLTRLCSILLNPASRPRMPVTRRKRQMLLRNPARTAHRYYRIPFCARALALKKRCWSMNAA
jgi:transcriptional regulator of acetoin/glycerol metabolism